MRKCLTVLIIAPCAWAVARNRPCLVGLQGKADQDHEQVDVCGDFQVQRHPLRARHEPDGGGVRGVVFEPPDGPRREVQANVQVGMKVGDLAVG